MKNLFILMAMVLWLTACNEEKGKKEEASDKPKKEKGVDPVEKRKVELGEYAVIVEEIQKVREESMKGLKETQRAKDEAFQMLLMSSSNPGIEPIAMELFMHNELDLMVNQQLVEMYTEVLAKISSGEEPGEIMNFWTNEMGSLQRFVEEQKELKLELAEELKKQLESAAPMP